MKHASFRGVARFFTALFILIVTNVNAEIISVGKGDPIWYHNVCRCTNGTTISELRADCEILDGGVWTGSGTNGDPLRCEDADHPRPWPSESFIEPLVSERSGGRQAFLVGWLNKGESISCTGCWSGGPQYSLGVEILNLSHVEVGGISLASRNESTIISGDEEGGSINYMARRDRSVSCPQGYTKKWIGGKHQCVITPEQCGGPETANPVTCGTGNKRHTENDYQAQGSSPLLFTRTYNSFGYYRSPDHADQVSASLGDHWRHTYDRYVFEQPSNSQIMATVVRPNGMIKAYDNSGQEVVNPGPGHERLERLTDGFNLTGWRYYTAQGEIEEYDENGRLQTITDRRGVVQTLSYSDVTIGPGIPEPGSAPQAGLLLQVEDSFGRILNFTYNNDAKLVSMTDPADNVYEYEYDVFGNLVTVTFPDSGGETVRKQYHYENNQYISALTGITDENGERFAIYTYDDEGRAVSTEHAGGVKKYSLTYTSDGLNYVTTVVDPLGGLREFQYETINGVRRNIAVSEPCAGCSGDSSSEVTYDANGFVATRTDFNGHTTEYDRDNRGLELSRTEAFGTSESRTVTTAWHETFHFPEMIEEPGRKTNFTYDATGNLLSHTVTGTGGSRTVAYTYNDLGLVKTVDGRRTDVSDITSYSYDNKGNLIKITNALGHVTQITSHDDHGNPMQIVDANGLETILGYDARQRLVSRTVDSAITEFEYDGVGQLTRVTLPNGASLTYTYDSAHRLTEIKDTLNNRIAYTLDAMGNRIKMEVFDPSGMLRRTQSQVYDGLNQLKEVHGANGQLTEYQYDANGNRISVTEAGLYSTLNQFDALDRLTKVTDADSGRTIYTYDALDRLTSVTDAEGLNTTYSYNTFGELIRQVSPDTGTTSYTYDNAGNRTSKTDARGITVNFNYDALNRLTQVDYPETDEDISYLYDGENYQDNEANGIGRLTGIEDQNSSITFLYDARGKLITDERVINGETLITAYQYDEADNFISMTYPSGRQVSFTRDVMGRITAVESGEDSIASDIDYLPFGPVTGMTMGNDIQVNRSYDLDYRVTSLTDDDIRDKQYNYDLRNQVIELQDLVNSSRSQSFAYDALGRLTDAQGNYGQLSYTYDAIGNRTSKTDNGVAQGYTYDPENHRLLQTGSTSYSYDAAGNTTAKGGQQYSYNQAGRMTRGPGATYRYNALGQRVTKTTPDALGNPLTTRFHYNQWGQLIAETGQQGNTIREYIYLYNLPIAMQATPKGDLDDTVGQIPLLGSILGGLLSNVKLLLPPTNLSPAPQFYYLCVGRSGSSLAST